MPTDSYALFAPGSACNIALPLNPITDEFLIVRFAPLHVRDDQGEVAPAVVPREAVHGEAIAAVTSRIESDLPVEAIAPAVQGGVPLGRRWRTPPVLAEKGKGRIKVAAKPRGDDLAPPAPLARTGATTAVAPAELGAGLSELFPSYQFVLYLPYRQMWELLGYSRGELLNSISLGPQEETTIEIFTWERAKRMREVSETFEEERASEATTTDKSSLELLKELSHTTGWRVNVGGGVTIPNTPINLSADFGASDELRDVNRSTQQLVSEAVRKSTARLKSTRQTKVTESEEVGREERVTRKIRNGNLCRALNYDYFEILATYRVTTHLAAAEARLCVAVPTMLNLFEKFDRATLLTFEGALSDALLSEVYRPGFVASRTLAAEDRLCAVRCRPKCACQDAPGQPPGEPPDDSPALAALRAAAAALSDTIGVLLAANPDEICELARTPWEDIFPTPERRQRWEAAKPPYRRWLYRLLALDWLAPRFWTAAVEFRAAVSADPAAVSPAVVERFIRSATPEVADIFNILLLGVRFWYRVVEIVGTLVVRVGPFLAPLIANAALDDAQFGSAFAQARRALDAYLASLQPAPGPGEPPGEEPEEPPPVYTDQQLAEALVSEAALLDHLRSNDSYYRQAIWYRMDPADRATFLAMYAPSGTDAPRLDPEVIGFMDKRMLLPFRLSDDAELREWFRVNVTENPDLQEARPPQTITLPTRGVAMETRLGSCDACEDFVKDLRVLELRQKAAEAKAAEERAKQEELESQRYQLRLTGKPQQLDDPSPYPDGGAIRIVLEQKSPSAAPK